MRLYFLRHGIAEDYAPTPAGDAARALTTEGIGKLKIAAKVIKSLEIKPAAIYSSPRVRARQTAEIVADALGLKVEIREALDYGFSPQSVASLIAGHFDDSELLFVGHEPYMSGTISGLIGGGSVEMKKGGLARVDLITTQPPRGMLVWLIAPKVFEALG